MNREHFQELVAQAVDELPDFFLEKLENVAILVEDEPGPELREEWDDRLLLGLYSGVPLSKRSVFGNYPYPDVITLYQRNIERLCRSDRAVIDQIRNTVIHEIGHHFGMNEEDLRKHGY
jgi:predicted Zn-dependent protease with MMP-like domain